jgi:sucrase/ferredoxin-like protein
LIPAGERCSARSAALNEPLRATASTVRSWLLLEQPGPWGFHALLESRLPEGLGGELHRRAREAGVRVLLIRRPGRPVAEQLTRACFAVCSGPGAPWLERADLNDPRDALDLDISGIRAGRRPGLRPVDGSLFLACTHGRRDPCCAERGRPLAAALARRFPERTWESSHIGGDRFAGNLVCFPHGMYFGRVGPEDVAAVAGAYDAGRIDLVHYRGRSSLEFGVQAAESFLRRREHLVGVDDLSLRAHHPEGDRVRVRFHSADGRAFEVRVRRDPTSAPRALTCQSRSEERPVDWELTEIEEMPRGRSTR